MNCLSIKTHSVCINIVKAGNGFSLFAGSVIGCPFSIPPTRVTFWGEYLECDSPLTLRYEFVIKENEPAQLTGWWRNKASYLICVVEAVIHKTRDQRRLSNCKRTKRGEPLKWQAFRSRQAFLGRMSMLAELIRWQRWYRVSWITWLPKRPN